MPLAADQLLYGILGVMFAIPVLSALQQTTQAHMMQSIGRRAFILLSAPGIVAHESAHATVNVFARHKIRHIVWFTPHPVGKGATLGHVDFLYDQRSSYQNVGVVLSALAPALLCPMLISALLGWAGWPLDVRSPDALYSSLMYLAASPLHWEAAVALICLSIGLHSSPSLADYRVANAGLSWASLSGVVVAGAVTGALYYGLSMWLDLSGLLAAVADKVEWVGGLWLNGMIYSAFGLCMVNVALLPLHLVRYLWSRRR